MWNYTEFKPDSFKFSWPASSEEKVDQPQIIIYKNKHMQI